MADDPKPAESTPQPTPKKTYEPPRLTIYGDVAKLTQHKTSGAVHDGGSGSHSHTA